MGRKKKFNENTISTALRLPESFYNKKPNEMTNSDWILLHMNVKDFSNIQDNIIQKLSGNSIQTNNNNHITNQQKISIKTFIGLFNELTESGKLDELFLDETKANNIFENVEILEGMI